jgi:predicted  nucleic acid-binding Zn-ribbon protein
VNPTKIDPKGPSEETFSRQLLEANKKMQKLETDLSTIKAEFREYRIEHDNYKKQAEKYEAETLDLKDRNAKLTQQFQK